MNADKMKERLSHLNLRSTTGDGILSFDCPPSELLKTAKILRDEFECQTLCDIASVDYGAKLSNDRFGAVYHFYSHTKKKYVRIVSVCESVSEPKLPSLCSVYKGADWHEREAFDMMGIVFENHPSLRRILMWDDYGWNPLRKDFPLAGKEAPLPPTFSGNEGVVKIVPAPEEGGPFHSPSCGVNFSSEKEPRSMDMDCGIVENP